jgi:hypothetical protein
MPQQSVDDMLAQAAKQYKGPQGNAAASTTQTAPNEDWKLWQTSEQGAQATPGVLDRVQSQLQDIMAPSPDSEGGFERFAHGFMRSSLNTLEHPLDTLGSAVKESLPLMPLIHDLRGRDDLAPYINSPHPAIDFAADQAGGIGGGTVLGVGSGAALEGGLKGGGALKNIIRPSPSPTVVSPAEMASRRLAQAVMPPTRDATSFINAAPLEVPSILQHAQESGNPLNTQLEFVKAAEAHAQQVRDFYENQVLKPNDKLVKTTGSGFGSRMGEGPDTYAKLSEIDKRIADINNQLSSSYGKLNPGDTREALASKTSLENEAARLRDILHYNLSRAIGISPEQIADLRQRVGRSYELANDTNAAVTSRMQGEGRAAQRPLHLSQLPARFLQTLSGGPNVIADRAFQRAIKAFPGEPQPLSSPKDLMPRDK